MACSPIPCRKRMPISCLVEGSDAADEGVLPCGSDSAVIEGNANPLSPGAQQRPCPLGRQAYLFG